MCRLGGSGDNTDAQLAPVQRDRSAPSSRVRKAGRACCPGGGVPSVTVLRALDARGHWVQRQHFLSATRRAQRPGSEPGSGIAFVGAGRVLPHVLPCQLSALPLTRSTFTVGLGRPGLQPSSPLQGPWPWQWERKAVDAVVAVFLGSLPFLEDARGERLPGWLFERGYWGLRSPENSHDDTPPARWWGEEAGPLGGKRVWGLLRWRSL